MNPHVLITTMSPSGVSLSCVQLYPLASKSPMSVSLSTRFLEHPMVMMSTVGFFTVSLS